MDLLVPALGMLACLAMMALVMPLAMRLVGRLRRPSTTHTAGGTPALPPQPPQAAPPQQPPREHG
jgi:hypothetical protein